MSECDVMWKEGEVKSMDFNAFAKKGEKNPGTFPTPLGPHFWSWVVVFVVFVVIVVFVVVVVVVVVSNLTEKQLDPSHISGTSFKNSIDR